MATKTSTASGPGRARAKTNTESTAMQKTTQTDTVAPDHEAVSRRAYEIWTERGGDAQANWLQAEAELANGGQLPD